jgi:hypothetical protein
VNRLRNSIFYLSGNIDGYTNSEDAQGWRKEAKAFLNKRGAGAFDPCEKPLQSYHEDEKSLVWRRDLKSKGDYDILSSTMRKISNIDLRAVDHSTALIVNIDLDKRPCGTIHEVMEANSQKKPCIICCKQGKDQVYDWFYGRLPHKLFFSTMSEVYYYLHDIDTAPNEEIEDLGRWIFFDYDKMFGRV